MLSEFQVKRGGTVKIEYTDSNIRQSLKKAFFIVIFLENFRMKNLRSFLESLKKITKTIVFF